MAGVCKVDDDVQEGALPPYPLDCDQTQPIAFLSTTLLEADDRAVRMAAGEALALCFELNLLDVSSREDDGVNTGGTTGSKNKLFLDIEDHHVKAGIGRTRNCFMFYGLNLYYINYQNSIFLHITCLEDSDFS
ncbi:hypothetical protein ACJX0J_037112 [Zea mays]